MRRGKHASTCLSAPVGLSAVGSTQKVLSEAHLLEEGVCARWSMAEGGSVQCYCGVGTFGGAPVGTYIPYAAYKKELQAILTQAEGQCGV